jgi:hypothetical protein
MFECVWLELLVTIVYFDPGSVSSEPKVSRLEARGHVHYSHQFAWCSVPDVLGR